MSVAGWFGTQALSLAQREVIKRFSESSLFQRLDAVVQKWADDLPDDAFLGSSQALLVPKSASQVDDPTLQPRRVITQLEQFEIPTPEDWAADLIARWSWVRKHVPERQPFFNLTKQKAVTHIEILADLLWRECTNDDHCFKTTAMTLLVESKEKQSQTFDLLLSIKSQLDANQSSRPLISTRALLSGPGVADDASETEDYTAQIDAAVVFLKARKPEITIAQLETLRQRAWDSLSDREKYRLLGNLGHAHLRKLDHGRAGRYFIDAKSFQPNDEQALCHEAIGFSLLDDRAKAFELAVDLRHRIPTSDLGNATWVRNAPENYSFDELEDEIPIELRDMPETAASLAWRAALAEDFVRAEAYARKALAHDPESGELREVLGMVLLQYVRKEALTQLTDPPVCTNPDKLCEAVNLLTAVIREVPPELITRKAYLSMHLGSAECIRGDAVEAENHFRIAYDMVPHDVDYVRNYAICLFDRKEYALAIRVLEGANDNDITGRNALLLANVLIERGADGDASRAIAEVNRIVPRLAEIAKPMRFDVIYTCLALSSSWTGDGGAAMLLSKTQATLESFEFHLLQAVAYRKFKDVSNAEAEARAALLAIPQEASPLSRRRVAIELSRLGLTTDALPLWKSIIIPRAMTADTFDVLRMAENVGDAVYVTTFCRELRRNGAYSRDIIHLELNTLQKFNSYASALTAMDEILKGPLDSSLRKEICVRHSHLLYAIHHDHIIRYDLSEFPDARIVPVDLGLAVVQVLQHGPEPMDGVRYAYELLRKNFMSHLAHRAMIISVLGSRGRGLEDGDKDAVSIGCAVEYQEEGTAVTDWFIIEDGPEPDLSRHEHAPSHPLALSLIGKRRGDVFALRSGPIGERSASIIRIVSKYKYRFQQCADNWETNFADNQFIFQIKLKTVEDGTPRIDQILKSIDERQAAFEKQDELYRANPLSTTNYAVMTQHPVIDVVSHLANKKGLPVRCCIGTDTEVQSARQAYKSSRPVIVDSTALATLYLADAFNLLDKLPTTLVISYGTLLEWRNALARTANESDKGFFITKQGHKYVVLPNDSDLRNLGRSNLHRFVQLLETKFQVEEGMPLAMLSQEDREQFIEFLGRAAAETIAIAKSKGYALWTDDLWVGTIAANRYSIPRMWTNAIFMFAGSDNTVSSSEWARVTATLIGMGYEYTQLLPNVFEWAGKEDQWSVAGPFLGPCISWLANPHTKKEGMLSLAMAAMVAVYESAPSPFLKVTLLTQIWHRIGDRQNDGHWIHQRIIRILSDAQGFDIAIAQGIREILNQLNEL